MPSVAANRAPAFEPVHLGILIRDMLNEACMSGRAAAGNLGVSPPTLNNILMGRSNITADMALRLSRLFGNAPEFWTRLQEGFDLWYRSRVLRSDLAKIERMAHVVDA